MATNTWTNGGGTGLWSTPGNWSLGHAPLAPEDVVFNAISAAACTVDTPVVGINSFDAIAYAGTVTFANGVVLATAAGGKFLWGGAANNLACAAPAAATLNVGGDFGATTHLSSNVNGLTVNLGGTAHTFYWFDENSGTSGAVINVLAGAAYTVNNTGWGGSTVNVYGTLYAVFQVQVGHSVAPAGYHSDLAVKAGGRVTPGAGAAADDHGVLLSYRSRLLEQSGTFDANLTVYSPLDEMVLAPGTYAGGRLWFASGGATQATALRLTAGGVYAFTGTVALDHYNQLGGSPPRCGWYVPDTTAVTVGQAAVTFRHVENGTLRWDWTGNGPVTFTAANSFTPSLTQMGNVELSGGTPTLQGDLLANRLTVGGGTFNPNGKNVTLRDDLVISPGAQFTPAGLNGSTVAVGGSLLAQGTSGAHLNWQATAGWTLNVAATPLSTANADYADVENCTATGGLAVRAVNCTDAGGNSGWDFAAAAGTRPATAFVGRATQALAAGAHTLEAGLAGQRITVRVDGTTALTYPSGVLNQGFVRHGVYSYSDGTYTLCPLDNFDVPDPSLPPAAPAGLAVTVGGLATWGLATGATAYELGRSVSGAGTYSVAYTGAAASFQDTVAPLAGPYDYRVRASSARGYGAYSAPYTVTYPLAPVLYDTFTDADGTTLAAHAMDVGPGWTVGSGGTATTILGNKVLGAGASPAASSGHADVTVTMDFTLAVANGVHGLILYPRFTDTSNFVRCDLFGDGTMDIYTRVAGTFSQLTTGSWSADTSTHAFKVVASGTTVTAYLDGVQKMQATGVTDFQSVANQGFNLMAGDTGDNFKVTSP